jgi:hypothetical protein
MFCLYSAAVAVATVLGALFLSSLDISHRTRVRLRMARGQVAALFAVTALTGCGEPGGLLVVEDGGADAADASPVDSGSNAMSDAGACATTADGLLCTLADGTDGECMGGACVTVPGACKLNPCPAASYQSCNSQHEGNTACCDGVIPILVCSTPAGISLDVCPDTCASGVCALSLKGAITCCDFALNFQDPCQQAVP